MGIFLTCEMRKGVKNLSPSLIKYFSPDCNINKNIETDWIPPKRHGLNNSFIIILLKKNLNNKKIKVDKDIFLHNIRNYIGII